jgi:hypothetical protein
MPSTVEFSILEPAGRRWPRAARRGDRTRTCKRRLWRPLRYQLRHTPMKLLSGKEKPPGPWSGRAARRARFALHLPHPVVPLLRLIHSEGGFGHSDQRRPNARRRADGLPQRIHGELLGQFVLMGQRYGRASIERNGISINCVAAACAPQCDTPEGSLRHSTIGPIYPFYDLYGLSYLSVWLACPPPVQPDQ